VPRKNTLLKFQNITNGAMSGNITSPATNIQFMDDIGVQLNFTGTPTGTFQIQVSIDYAQDAEGNIQNAGNWIPINLPSSPVASGGSGFIYIDLNMLSAPWIRVVYIASSGVGVLNSFLTGKEV